MPGPPSTLKKALLSEGFEIYRTAPNLIALADRVRDNLLMDSGVAVVEGENVAIRVVLRAQASNFPGESGDGLLARARTLSAALTERGYTETGTDTVSIPDPGDRSRTIDTWYEVTYSLPGVAQGKLYDELRFALSVTKNAERS